MKRKTVNWFLIGGAIVGVGLIIRQFTGGIVTHFKGLKWLGFEGIRIRFAMFYDVENQNDIGATVSSLKGKIFYGDYRLSDVTIEQPVSINPGQTESMEVRFSVSPGALLGELTRFFEEKSGFKKFSLKGVMVGKIGEIPFRVPLNEKLGLAE